MHIISQKKLRDFWSIQPNAELDLRKWYVFVRKSQWRGPTDIKKCFATASFLRDNRVVVNIGGNNFRLVVKVVYETLRVCVRFVGTHAAYDRIDAESI